ncbi:ribosome small subunit-dependent GTPase A [Pseudoduganella namucuonensis]|uniref:Ribosome biogenesis GTPase n=1 Tax=Pseudoduganella namucuonensis TaxID=1035707 RepID=A0A1I7G979_9BURK|nr:ribosome small subunit-dependent GTPase A [Pseudoduganella namucuonensis]SFU44901.1 ribosome biogenesis GTPase [Pseudoduganella namucuonensis]
MIAFNFEQLRHIGFKQLIAGQLGLLEPVADDARLMRITEVQREWLTVHDGVRELKARALAKLHGEYVLAVGDWVVVDNMAHGELWISQRLSPVNHISRRSYDGRRQAIASNIDTALLVMGLDHDFNVRRLERYIALTEASEVSALIVLTKCDIGHDIHQRVDELRRRIPARYPIVAVNALDAASVSALDPWLGYGQTLCLLGSSGAGKSTLTNTLSAAHQETGVIREGDSRGRHTTTFRSMHICATGACIIDAPGLRTLRPDGGEDSIAAAFDDIDSLAAQCQFRDCKHELEPGCAVRDNIDPDRLFNYRKLMRDIQRSQQTPLERIAERSRWKVIHKAASARNRDKRG